MDKPTTYNQTENPQLTPISIALDAFIVDKRASNCTPRTVTTYRERLTDFAKWLSTQGITQIEQIKPTAIRAYFLSLQDRNLSAWTIHGQARAVKTFSRWLVFDEWLTKSPMTGVKMPKAPRNVLPAISLETVDKLLATADNKRDYALVLFLLDTGCRAMECCNLDAGDIDLTTGAVNIRMGKGRKNRQVYLGARSRKALLKYWRESGYPQPHDPAWLSIGIRNHAQRLTYEGLRMAIRRLSHNAGVKVTLHAFRRTFAIWSLRAGMDIYSLQRIMGHEDLQVLRQYLDLNDEDTAIAHQRFGAVDTILGNTKKRGR